MIQFILNNKDISTDLPPGTLLLDFIRYQQHLTSTKIGCREGDCGACSVLTGEIRQGELIYRSATSCLMAIGNAAGKHIVTVEGTNVEGLNYIQQSFANEGASQCGFCTPGFMVSLAGFALSGKPASCANAIDAVNGNVCRCTGYKSIERAAASIAHKLSERSNEDPISFAVANNILPAYFTGIKERLLQLKLQQNGHLTRMTVEGKQKKYLGGGTDLYVQQHDSMHHEDIEFLFDKEPLNGITQLDNRCYMGAAVTVTDILESTIFQRYFPALNEHIKLVSSTPIRNMATIAGNLVNASPIGDFTIFLLALNAQLLLTDGEHTRELPLREFYVGYKQLAKQPVEFIQQIWFELPGPNCYFNFEKVCKRTHLDIASVNSAICLRVKNGVIDSAWLSAGGVGPVPAYLANASAAMIGKPLHDSTIEEAVTAAQQEINPISDARGTAAYKTFLLGQLIKAHFVQLFPTLPLQVHS